MTLNLRTALGRLDLSCAYDVLNPCWDDRPTDVPGKHWGGCDACPQCTVRSALEGRGRNLISFVKGENGHTYVRGHLEEVRAQLRAAGFELRGARGWLHADGRPSAIFFLDDTAEYSALID